ncbi:nuclear transport factor 2 family protein [Rhodococcus sp. NPDC047139]|uniref:nuclear transport factor 2 family protein n=1 Tax=Rhodococcus sp. NPDC047139 TaxID=3155141 RepID=UPI0033E12C4A
MSVEGVLTAYFEAYNSEEPDRLAELLDKDVVLHSAAGTEQGLSTYLDAYRSRAAVFVDRMIPDRIEVNGDMATVTILNTLTARVDVPDFMGAPVGKGRQ